MPNPNENEDDEEGAAIRQHFESRTQTAYGFTYAPKNTPETINQAAQKDSAEEGVSQTREGPAVLSGGS